METDPLVQWLAIKYFFKAAVWECRDLDRPNDVHFSVRLADKKERYLYKHEEEEEVLHQDGSGPGYGILLRLHTNGQALDNSGDGTPLCEVDSRNSIHAIGDMDADRILRHLDSYLHPLVNPLKHPPIEFTVKQGKADDHAFSLRIRPDVGTLYYALSCRYPKMTEECVAGAKRTLAQQAVLQKEAQTENALAAAFQHTRAYLDGLDKGSAPTR